ncbi:Exoglucanase 1 [Tricholoma furcatifolium]|nr:Exoglucanase 1 [Tricholoma furcatifolium]
MGDTTFYGPSMTVDTTQKFTVVTQFISSDGTSSGSLSEIRRIYVQNGVVIQNSNTNIAGMSTYNSITEDFCDAQKAAFGDTTSFQSKGGLTQMGDALSAGMVLVLSLWDDYAVDMLWLDSDYPTNASVSSPGVARGTCATTSGVPATVEADYPNSSVTYSNIRFGQLNSTYSGTSSSSSSTTSSSSTSSTSKTSTSTSSSSSSSSTSATSTVKTTSTTSTSTSSASTATQTLYGQCGGTGWTGPTACASGSTCTYSNPYYSQCLA